MQALSHAAFESDTSQPDRLSRSLRSHLARFQRPRGADLLERTAPFHRWSADRRHLELWPYSRTLAGPPLPTATIHDERGVRYDGVNFASQDYLGLASHDAVRNAVVEALYQYGPHSSGSPVLVGNTQDSLALEGVLADWLRMKEVLLFPTGWAAGFAAIHGLVQADDHIILDERAHACLQAGARAATSRLSHVPHMDIAAVERRLKDIRASDTQNAVLVVSEGLYSMDSDTPDLRALQTVCRDHSATLFVDIAHDLGSLGPDGLGALGEQGLVGEVDLVMGSFSKTFASNGGFLATHSAAVRQFVKYFGGPHIFSNALSPLQTAAVRAAIGVVRSTEGERLRRLAASASERLRAECIRHDLRVLGRPSPIVPVVVGGNPEARLASARLARGGVLANLVEYPAVPINSTRFRFQVMPGHTPEQCESAARTMADALAHAHRFLQGLPLDAPSDSTP